MARQVTHQAVVVIHGMGEQLPMSTLTHFVDTALEPGEDGHRTYYSRPESVTGSFESRRFVAPKLDSAAGTRPRTDVYEYHWADKMQGNRLDDLWPTFRRMLLQWPTRVPRGLKAVWLLGWVAILASAWAAVWGPWNGIFGGDDPLKAAIGAVVSGGLTATVLSYVLSRVLPAWLTSSFVDVVRYLDTSPRSYAVRREIRKGLVEMIQGLHASEFPRYDRIVLVAHSLGAYIAYDGIAYLWGLTNSRTDRRAVDRELAGLEDLERAASALPDTGSAAPAQVDDFQAAQHQLWEGLREQGNPWLITDFVSVGTPMYFADQLMHGKGARSFTRRIERRELPTCPPQNEEADYNNIHDLKRFYSWRKPVWVDRKSYQRRVLYEGAPFAVVRWTNVFFPIRLGFFGDWFGGPLVPLFGSGIKDVPITGNTPRSPGTSWYRHRLVPAAAHSYYFDFPDDDSPGSAAAEIRAGLRLTHPAPPTPAPSDDVPF